MRHIVESHVDVTLRGGHLGNPGWYLFRSQWPPAPDRIVIYTQADNLEVMQRFYSTLASGTSAIARDCWHTCQVGTCGADWYPSPPASPLPTGWSIVFTYP